MGQFADKIRELKRQGKLDLDNMKLHPMACEFHAVCGNMKVRGLPRCESCEERLRLAAKKLAVDVERDVADWWKGR